MLPKLLKTLLGSEPCVELRLDRRTATYSKDWQEMVTACNEGARDSLFIFRFQGETFKIAQPTLDRDRFPDPTICYFVDESTKKLL